jgi:signal transduction histidine kinase
VGLALCYTGLATPEKAYRRSHQLLARESSSGRYEPLEIDGQSGRILYHPPAEGHVERLDPELGQMVCGVREGMLEAVPMLFGLVPARVRETECAYHGAHHCVFEVSWTRTPRSGLLLGALAGIGIGAGLGFSVSLAGLPLWSSVLVGLGVAALTAVAGRSVDLARQLEAVAGARRGQLALLDQLDTSLAEKLDEFAQLGAVGAGRPAVPQPSDIDVMQGLVPVRRSHDLAGAEAEDGPGAVAEGALAEAAGSAASGIRDAVTALRGQLAALHASLRAGAAEDGDPFEALLRDCAGHGRRIEELAVELGSRVRAGAQVREPCDLVAIVERTIASLRVELPSALTLDVELEAKVPSVIGDPFQLEYMLDQLLRNAADAVESDGIICVKLRRTLAGVELSVEDDGEGIEPDTVDRVFDPFSDATQAGQDGGFGLPVCYRIVEEHGGELQVLSAEGSGTRVSVVLPAVAGDGG